MKTKRNWKHKMGIENDNESKERKHDSKPLRNSRKRSGIFYKKKRQYLKKRKRKNRRRDRNKTRKKGKKRRRKRRRKSKSKKKKKKKKHPRKQLKFDSSCECGVTNQQVKEDTQILVIYACLDKNCWWTRGRSW